MEDQNFKNFPPTKFDVFYNVFKEKMFKIEIEDGREAPLKPSIFKNSTHTVYFHSKARGKPKNQIKSNRKKYLRNLR